MKTKFYTGAGDKGSTKLGKCSFNKDEPLFDALGNLDELNSVIGWCKVEADKKKFKEIKKSLTNIQNNLFIAQAETAAKGMQIKNKIVITDQKTKDVEDELEVIDAIVPPLKNFIIPGGTELATRIEIGRAISRRVERSFVALNKKMKVSKDLLQYLNRLSSILFALARLANHIENVKYEHPTYK